MALVKTWRPKNKEKNTLNRWNNGYNSNRLRGFIFSCTDLISWTANEWFSLTDWFYMLNQRRTHRHSRRRSPTGPLVTVRAGCVRLAAPLLARFVPHSKTQSCLQHSHTERNIRDCSVRSSGSTRGWRVSWASTEDEERQQQQLQLADIEILKTLNWEGRHRQLFIVKLSQIAEKVHFRTPFPSKLNSLIHTFTSLHNKCLRLWHIGHILPGCVIIGWHSAK